ncbi:MAG: hypothetical protein FP824_02390 [Euryarchaeota archaeon]|nr:hypothetical protein [Euryarchaeota archaeon]
MIDKHKLANDNILLWLGTTGGQDNIDNVLILAGGDVLFLKTVEKIPLWRPDVRKDLNSLDYKQFIQKYNMPIDNIELWNYFKRGVDSKELPAFSKINAHEEYKRMIRKYVHSTLQFKDPEAKIKVLDEIIRECETEKFKIQKKK